MPHEINELDQLVGMRVPNWTPPLPPPRETLVGRLCRIEPVNPSVHAASLYESDRLDHDGSSWTYLPYGPFPTPDAYRDWLAASAASNDPLFFAIVDQDSGDAVGIASYLRIAPAAGSIEIGHLHFSPRLQRTPAATEALYLLIARAFGLGYRRLEWKCDALNAPSRRAAQRLGLSFEGVFRQATVTKGRNRDTAWYSAIDAEWPALQSAFMQWLHPENFDANGAQKSALSALTAPLLVCRG